MRRSLPLPGGYHTERHAEGHSEREADWDVVGTGADRHTHAGTYGDECTKTS
jgi:hypothetical protein